jgi:hypothetical protein
MEFLTYLGAITLSYLGLLGGLWQIFIAPEELAPGRKFFYHTFYILFSAALFFAIYMFDIMLHFRIAITLITYILLIFVYKKIPLMKYLVYPLLGFFLGISSKDPNWFLLLAGIIMLIGFPFGSLSVKEYRKKDRWLLTRRALGLNVVYFITAIIFFFI